MTSEAIFDTLSKIFHDVFDDDSIVATPTLTADDVDGWDSLAHLRLIATVEETFAISFTASQIAALQKVGDLANLIELKLKKA
jgi:acyl carrier protein